MKLVVVISGGLVDVIVSDEPIDVLVVNRDSEGADEEDILMIDEAECTAYLHRASVIPGEAAQYFAEYEDQV